MKAGRLKQGLARQWLVGIAALALPALAWAQAATPDVEPDEPVRWQLNMTPGITHTSQMAYDAHMFALWVCVAIGVLVFGAMAVAMVKFRKSKGAVAAQFSHNTTAEVIWTIVPIIILIVMVWPATAKLIAQYDTRDSTMTVKVTGYQWLWKYEYLGENVALTSRLDRASEAMRQSGRQPTLQELPHYLRDVDNPLVLPVDTKIRFVITADDVIHAWWVPALGWKQDAIPGIVNEAWTDIKKPGIYRGQCAELCGKDHGFMPIVVKAVSKAEFRTWLAAEQAKNAPPAVAAPAPAPAEAAPAEAAPAEAAPAEAAPAEAAPAEAAPAEAAPTAAAAGDTAEAAAAAPAA
ncbi:cytochrome c oxidase subunit II [Luteimonas sp. 50]|uniref:Cytochrome c oxidase subunit 2 n=1 Tax=Cognatiluteimonas sedimenti TaxID=2927791 RepID=A0ABT0A686_9GAMM|nr:cytochrome c oxidase subunit II [Lysobacter sedimenti]MCJ0826496.1 cytochrome c oxidase subunit II [Lysobacter sedimenti]